VSTRSTYLVIHGPNLDLLGLRQPEIYGRLTLKQIDASLRRRAAELGVGIETVQSNYDVEIVERIKAARGRGISGIVINPAAYTHTSEEIPRAIAAAGLPAVEVHLSNVHARETFRRLSLVAPVVTGGIFGLGAFGYLLALEAVVHVSRHGRSRRPARLTPGRRLRRMPAHHD